MYVAVYINPHSHHSGYGGVLILVPLSDLVPEDQKKIRNRESMTGKQVGFFCSLDGEGGWSNGKVVLITDQEQSLLIDQLIEDNPPQFYPKDLPGVGANLRAARARGLTFDPVKQHYVDHNLVPILDVRGVPLF